MKSKYLKIASLITQGIHSTLCVADMVICVVYRLNYDSTLGTLCAEIALPLTGICCLFPFFIVVLVLNICVLTIRQAGEMFNKKWLVWTIVSPVVYVVFYISVIMVFVLTTGGV